MGSKKNLEIVEDVIRMETPPPIPVTPPRRPAGMKGESGGGGGNAAAGEGSFVYLYSPLQVVATVSPPSCMCRPCNMLTSTVRNVRCMDEKTNRLKKIDDCSILHQVRPCCLAKLKNKLSKSGS